MVVDESPEIFPDFETSEDDMGNIIDWLGGNITIEFPQEDGSTKSYTYEIPEDVLAHAIAENDIEPIAEYLANEIASRWQRALGASAEAKAAQYENAKAYTMKALEEKMGAELKEIDEARKKETEEKTTVLNYIRELEGYIKDSEGNITDMEDEIADILVIPSGERTSSQRDKITELDSKIREEKEFIKEAQRIIKETKKEAGVK